MSEYRKTLRDLYNEELDERIIDLLQSDRLSEEDCELVSELGRRFIQQRQDQSLIETNLKGELDFREAKIERVIEVFECLLDIDKPCEDTCSYSLGGYRCDTTRLYKETLALLKEQHAEIERLKQEKADAVKRIERCRQNCISSEKDCDIAYNKSGKEWYRAKADAYKQALDIINQLLKEGGVNEID